MQLKHIIISTGLVGAIFLPGLVTAAETTGVEFDPSKNNTFTNAEYKGLTSSKALTFLSGAADPVTATVNLINVLLSFLGLISVIMFLYAGIIWFRSGDNEEELKKAKDIIIGTVIGLVLTLGAYSLSYMLFWWINFSAIAV